MAGRQLIEVLRYLLGFCVYGLNVSISPLADAVRL